MPDWSYHTIFKPTLAKLSARNSRNFIHTNLNIISSIPFGAKLIEFLGHSETDGSLEKVVHNLKIKTPIGLSSSIDPQLTCTNAFLNLGFGLIEIGPIVANKSLIQSPIINLNTNKVTHFEAEEALSLDQIVTKLKKIKRASPIFARIQGNFADFKKIESQLSNLVDLFIVDCQLLTEMISNSYNPNNPICLAIPVCEIDIISLNNERKVDSIILEENSSYSSIENKNALIKSIHTLNKLHIDKPIFTKGGIIEPKDAIDLLNAGADVVLLSDGYVTSGPGLPKRINEALMFQKNEEITSNNGWYWYFLFGLIMFIGGFIALFISLTSIILPYDEAFLHTKRESILQFSRTILPFMSHDRMTLSGTIISGGILFMSLAKYGIRNNFHWAKKAADRSSILGFLGIFLFIGFKYFDWLHALFWLFLLPPYLIGFMKTKGMNRSPSSPNIMNHRYWKKSLIGQLSFIILGYSLVIGGLLISKVGVTTTFVSTDLSYLCLSPSQLNEFNSRLIPVISHDRAGFGGSLISVGFLILMISLWGFQQGNKWIWWTLLFGSIPPFLTAFGVHFMIGYTDFIHLLPPMIALLFLIIGLAMSYQYLHYWNEKEIQFLLSKNTESDFYGSTKHF